MERGRAELITILEHTNSIHSRIYVTKMLSSNLYEELEKLRIEAEGGEARTVTGCLIDILLVVLCFWTFGFWIGLVATFITISIVYFIENKIRKIKNIGRGSEIKKYRQEYETKKDSMEKDMKKYDAELEKLEKDLIYGHYVYVLDSINGRHDITINTIIEILRSEKAGTIKAALESQGVNMDKIVSHNNAMLSRGEPEIMQHYFEAAEQGDIRAQSFWGNLSYKVDDKEEALRWYLMAANQISTNSEVAVAQTKCGEMYYNGEGTQVNKKEALKWYLKAAEFGNGKGKLMCGQMYYNGEGTQEDKQEAFRWYLSAAQNDLADAQFACGKMYFYGEGIPQNKKEALKWLSKAAEQGHQKAKQMYDESAV